MKRIAREYPFDLVHAQHYGGATRAYMACRLYGWPMVYEIHSLLGDEVERDRLGRGLVFRTYMAMEKRVVAPRGDGHRAGRAGQAGGRRGEGRARRSGARHLPGHRPGRIRRPPASRRRSPGIGPEHKVIMYVGSIVHPNQGVPILIEALPRIFDAMPEARCVLVGGPAEAGETYRSRLGAFGDRLIVLTGQTPEQVVALTRRADVLVHPRLACRENYSVQSKIAVYLAAGRPIVATDFGDYQAAPGRHRRRAC